MAQKSSYGGGVTIEEMSENESENSKHYSPRKEVNDEMNKK